MALGTLTMTKSGRMPGCFDTATGGAAAGVFNASTIGYIPSGMTAIAPMINSSFTCLFLSSLGVDQTLGVTGQRGMVGVPPGAGPCGTIKAASAGVNYLRLCGATQERVSGSTIKVGGGALGTA